MIIKSQILIIGIFLGSVCYGNAGILPDSADAISRTRIHAGLDDTLRARGNAGKTDVAEANERVGASWANRALTYRFVSDIAAQQLNSIRSDGGVTNVDTASLRAFRFDRYAGGTLQTLGLGVVAAGDLSSNQALSVLPELSAVWFLPSERSMRWSFGAVYGYFFGTGKLLPLVGFNYRSPSGFQLHALLPVLIKMSWQTIERDRVGFLTQLDGKIAKIQSTAVLTTSTDTATLQERELKVAAYYDHKFASGEHATGELGVRAFRQFEVLSGSQDAVISAANEGYVSLSGTF